jgi:hypothetical protein
MWYKEGDKNFYVTKLVRGKSYCGHLWRGLQLALKGGY